MNRTDTLLRLKRFRVDEMKRRIAAIDAMKADLEKKLADLDDNVAREKQRAGDSDIGRLAFPPSCAPLNRAAKICARP
jgi:flagellar FliJ protein